LGAVASSSEEAALQIAAGAEGRRGGATARVEVSERLRERLLQGRLRPPRQGAGRWEDVAMGMDVVAVNTASGAAPVAADDEGDALGASPYSADRFDGESPALTSGLAGALEGGCRAPHERCQ